jgi:hypothetical protein
MQKLHRSALSLAACTAAAVLSACGSGGGASTPTATTKAAATTTPAATTTSTAPAPTPVPTSNPPWYPSLQAFEHYDSGRSHVFSMATFDGSLNAPNTVDLKFSKKDAYPSGYNMSWLNADTAFIQGGSYGDVEGSVGPYVAKIDPVQGRRVRRKRVVPRLQGHLGPGDAASGAVTPYLTVRAGSR